MNKIVLIALLALLLVFFVCVGPFFTIWSFNTLFGFEIPFTFKTWIAIIWLTAVIHGVKIGSKSE